MEITVKEVPPIVFLASTHQTTIPQLAGLTDRIVPQLYAAANEAGLPISGPMQFLYDGVDGTMDKQFELVIALPLASKPAAAPAPFTILEAPAFRCASMDYVGSMQQIQKGYEALLTGMQHQDLQMTSKSREIYKHWVDFDSPEDVTELQLGIA